MDGICRCDFEENFDMSDAISSVTATQAPETRTKRVESKSDPAPRNAATTENVQLSSAAQAALREATETPAQTAKEANGGDVQAKHLLAKRAADNASKAARLHVLA
jgi:hypothetical protein